MSRSKTLAQRQMETDVDSRLVIDKGQTTGADEIEEYDAADDEEEDDNDGADGGEDDEDDSEGSDEDGTSGDDTSDGPGETSEEEDLIEGEPATTTGPQQKAISQPPSMSGWQILGPLPTVQPELLQAQPRNTRRRMRLDKIKRHPKRSHIQRQVSAPPPRPPPPAATLSPPIELETEGSSESGIESDGFSSNTEDEDATTLPSPTSNTTSSATGTIGAAGVATVNDRPTTISSPTATKSTLIIEATPSGPNQAAASAFPTGVADSAGISAGPAPEERIAIIAGCTVLGVALLVAGLYCLFRFCVPVRTWYSDRRRHYRDKRSERLGTSPQDWKWPLQFIFGSDRPAPPRRKITDPWKGDDMESNPTASATMVADGFRPMSGQGAAYKLHHQKITGTAKWFFGAGGGSNKESSRWSDSEASEVAGHAARTTYSENTFINLYGKGSSSPPTTILDEKAGFAGGAVQISQVELAPPLPVKQNFNTNSKPNPNPVTVTSRNLPPPIPALPSKSNRASTATTATNFTAGEIGTAVAMPISTSPPPTRSNTVTTNLSSLAPPQPLYLGAQTSHFSASTLDPATPRTFICSQNKFELPDIPSSLVRPDSMGSVSSVDTVDVLGGGLGKVGSRDSAASASSAAQGPKRGASMRGNGIKSVGDGKLPQKRAASPGKVGLPGAVRRVADGGVL
ncbi:uncharacterized protein AB675_8186 [Cyphellophora attinorum]|uniref:Uncharacterized protein n=1 Tax=Cyphellophora attinorum TaxID=1664694 RepID=A0A0N1HVD3_9EURO|nr:uncharacterized protein AB675_8186 [Phialophora attinorum]KPI41216.1 hypothetical protein AB675_8186 [Phialophora attinorum]